MAERFINTLLGEWADALPFHTSEERNHWLPGDLGLHHSRRWALALGGPSPQQVLEQLLVGE